MRAWLASLLVALVLVATGEGQCLQDASAEHAWVWSNGQNERYNISKTYDVDKGEPGPGSRMWSAATQVGGDGFLFGGYGFTPFREPTPFLPSMFGDVWIYPNKPPREWKQLTFGDDRIGGRMFSVVFAAARGFFLFGGTSRNGAIKNDMWFFDIEGSNFTEMVPATAAVPSPRSAAAGWSTPTTLYLFGGTSGAGVFSDMWAFDIAASRWTLMGGSNATDSSAVFGGFAPWPGARQGASCWTVDGGKQLLLFGGLGFSDGRAEGNLADTWLFSIANKRWSVGPRGPLNHRPDFSLSELVPEARQFAQYWYNWQEETPYLYGGQGVNSLLSDLWRFNVGRQWQLVSDGPQARTLLFYDAAGCYGEKKVMAMSNLVPSRRAGAAFFLGNGDAVIIGGVGANAKGFDRYGVVSDTWVMSGAVSGGLNIPAIVVPLVLLALLVLLLLLLLLLRWRRRRQGGIYVVDLGGGQFKSNAIFKVPSICHFVFSCSDFDRRTMSINQCTTWPICSTTAASVRATIRARCKKKDCF